MTETASIPSTADENLQVAVDSIRKGDMAAGELALRAITQQFPEYLHGWGHLAYLLLTQGRYREAADCYRKCQEIVPGLFEAYSLEAQCHGHLGGFAEAAQCWRRSRPFATDPVEAILEEANCLSRAGTRREVVKTLLSLRNTASFFSEEVQSLLRRNDSAARFVARGITRRLPQILHRVREPNLVWSLLRELRMAPRSGQAFRDSGLRTFFAYLGHAYLDNGLHRHLARPCDLCGSRRTRNVFYLPDRKVVRCGRCGLERLERIPPGGHDLNSGFYERDDVLNSMSQEWDSPHIVEHRMSWLRTLFLIAGVHFPEVGQRLFEIGCGGGQLLDHLNRSGMEVAGIDASGRLVESVRDRYGLQVTHSTVESLQSPTIPYDFVFSYHVIEHLERPSVLFEKARQFLKPGGFLFIETPVPDLGRVSPELKRHRTHGYGSSEHTHFFTRSTLKLFFERFGFAVVGSYEHVAGDLPNGGVLGRIV